jgi:hypothetical protein
MIDAKFLAYRAVATQLEDEYYEFSGINKDAEEKMLFLSVRLNSAVSDYHKVCSLRLLCQEIAYVESIRGIGTTAYGSAKDRYDELYRLAYFDPLSISDCASFYFYDIKNVKGAKKIAFYGAYTAEHLRAYVRNSHQVLLRIAYADGDLSACEVAVRRISEYVPHAESPDPAIESDIVTIVGKLNLETKLKVAFYNAVSDQNS